MIIKIKHESHYALEVAARRAVQYLRLTPRNDRNQRVLHWSVTGPESLKQWTDGFGNIVHIATENAEHHDLKIIVEGEIETKDTAGVLKLDDGLPPIMFLRETPLTEVSPELEAFSQNYTNIREEQGDISFLHELMNGLANEITYVSGVSDVTSNAADVFESKKGVCQDFAHLYIAACRVHNVPCRYISGYITNGIGEPASHAWAEAYIHNFGWISMDPSNRQSATESYVRLAIGYDYSCAAPIIGVRTGGYGEKLNIDVQVSQKQE
ncbi:Transglutaminase domain protein [Candidatus Terasakiella magnetica]|uniref:Transglutaminase domain protein n=1 Tax=Candidatus Terasakiella magnetica TaxID=1867952 RepID=A0A1C3RL34_9PROT|nr:transglutaminase family protein [Candidatus Terasakiella magnetica]SCA57953.1 Transglutaminase domain protein [Candidatus Terasakiella magnetica]